MGTVGLLLTLIFLSSCFKKSNAQFGGAVTIDLSLPRTTQLPLTPSITTTITASVFDPSNQGVTWTVSPLNFGSLSAQTSATQPGNLTMATVNYTSPASYAVDTIVTVTATSITNPNVSTSIPIEVAPISVALQVFAGTGVFGAFAPVAYAQTIGPGQQLMVAATVLPTDTPDVGVTWSLNPPDAGSISVIDNVATYTAPTAVSSPLTVTLAATSDASSGAIGGMQITVFPSLGGSYISGGSNVAAVRVDGGPVPDQFYPNAAFTSVTLCNPGSNSSCQTIDGVLVDTGSYGLRILQSKIPLLKLPAQLDTNGNTLESCDALVNGSYLWGPVSQSQVFIAGEVTTAFIQVVSSTPIGIPQSCSNGGTDLNTPQLLGANGILGIGPEPTDCTLAGVNYCDGSVQTTPPNLYYACPSVGCAPTDSPILVPAVNQVGNISAEYTSPNQGEVLLFNQFTRTTDGGGVILQLPSVSGAQSSVIGTLTFGIGTESNNQLGSQTVFDLDANDYFTTVFNGQTLTNSFLDSGSNALYFPDSLPTCPDNSFFCPTSLTNLSAQNQGATQGQSTINFSVDNADALFTDNPGSAAFSTLAGPRGTFQGCSAGNTSCVFDWGVPFFYGRTVYVGLDSCAPPVSSCSASSFAYWAY